jgi:glycosyltransferase involved in cell wall biosynthesis
MLAQFYPPILGGEEQYTRSLSVALAARGHDVAVLTLRQRDLPEFEIDQGVRVYRVRGTLQRLAGLFSDPDRQHAPPFPDPELGLAVARVLKAERPQIVHAHNWLGYQYLPLQWLGSARLVVSLHDMSMICAKKSYMYDGSPCSGPSATKCGVCAIQHYGVAKGAVTLIGNMLMGALERQSVDMFLPVSQTTAERNMLPHSTLPFTVMPNFLGDELFEPQPGYESYLATLPSEQFVMFAGGFRQIKGLDVLLDAYRQLEGAPPLVLIGYDCADTPDSFPSNVVVQRNWPHGAVMEAWRRSMLGVVPSLCLETFGLVALEAMAAGRPVVASGLGGLAEVVADGETGILVAPGDVRALRCALDRLIASPKLRSAMGDAARRRADGFRASVVVPRVEHVYERVIRQGD